MRLGTSYYNQMERIPIGDHYYLIDSEDADLISGFNWYPLELNHTVYFQTHRRKMHLLMHRLIAGAGASEMVDHANGDGWDNRKNNLRIATSSQNGANIRLGRGQKHTKPKTSKFKGVSWDSGRQRWFASIHIEGKQKALGRFDSEIKAARAYDKAALAAWGEYARLNLEGGDHA